MAGLLNNLTAFYLECGCTFHITKVSVKCINDYKIDTTGEFNIYQCPEHLASLDYTEDIAVSMKPNMRAMTGPSKSKRKIWSKEKANATIQT